MTKDLALKHVDDFAARTTAGKFTKLDRAKIAAGLRIRINNPYKINQTSAGVCGPAAILFSIAQSQPLLYATAVTSLFETGTASIRKWKLEPDAELLTMPCPAGLKDKAGNVVVPFEHVDWIILASIRDSENWWYDYHSDKDESDGTTMSEIEAWMAKAQFTDIQVQGFSFFSFGGAFDSLKDREKFLAKCKELVGKNYRVVIGIQASIIDSAFKDSPKLDHVVVIRSDFEIPTRRDSRISIPIFTWGSETTLPRIGGLTYEQFLKSFFFYVAGKY
jgi:hypothetical protein